MNLQSKPRLRKLLLCIVMIGFATFSLSMEAHSQEPLPTPSDVVSTPTAPVTQQDIEIAILQAQLETANDYRQDLIEIVTSSLWGMVGVLVGLTILLLGYNWFTNNRSFQQERDSFRREQTEYIKGEIQTLNQALQVSLANNLQQMVKEELAYISSRLENLQESFRVQENSLLQQKGDEWKTTRVYANWLNTRMKQLHILAEGKYNNIRITSVLLEILNVLNELKNKGATNTLVLSPLSLSDSREALSRVQKIAPNEVSKILQLLESFPMEPT